MIFNIVNSQMAAESVNIQFGNAVELGTPVSRSISRDRCDMRICTAKYVLKKLLQSEIAAKEIIYTVIDDSIVLHVIHWPAKLEH